MSNNQFSKRELEILKNYFINKMSSHLKPIPLINGRFFDGKLEIDIAMPFHRLFDFDFEFSEVTQNIYIENTDSFYREMIKEFVDDYINAVKINGKYLADIINETGYKLKIIENPVVYMTPRDIREDYLIKCDYLSYKRNPKQYDGFKYKSHGLTPQPQPKKSLALVTDDIELEKWEFKKQPTIFSKTAKVVYTRQFHINCLAGELDPKWFEWVDEFELIVIPAILEVLKQALIDTYHNDPPISVEELKNLIKTK